MKKSHLLALTLIAVAVGAIIVLTASSASSYVTFEKAYSMAEEGDAKKIHVVGTLKKNDQGDVVGLAPSPDRLSFSFIMVDDSLREQKVYYSEPMPTDFLRSEKVVVIGSYKGDTFIASKILLKCPSKYQEELDFSADEAVTNY